MMRTILGILALVLATEAALPIVLWHGMGDSCCSGGSLGKIITLLENNIPGVQVHSLSFGNTTFQDVESGYFLNANEQVRIACDYIASNAIFEDGYNAIGFSQGGQFLRAVAQRCPTPPMKTLVSLGGQHQGVYGLPNCGQPTPTWCDYIRKLLNYGAYVGWVQKALVQAQYWHDPLNEEEYREYSLFIADINNEKAVKNEEYSDNLNQLEKLVLVLFNNDTMVTPRESSWFGFYEEGQSVNVVPYTETRVFKEDLIGLRALVSSSKVDFVSVDGDHLQFTNEWFLDEIVNKYLN